ncbi:hypothetical protein LCGC14_1698410 [marine sediment metagenome]|uniref:Uncharacterized protein n=1 Tax=marine sediment metagenome TaxID=412755 RepID=A0A0F9HIH7_9ZZZZ
MTSIELMWELVWKRFALILAKESHKEHGKVIVKGRYFRPRFHECNQWPCKAYRELRDTY